MSPLVWIAGLGVGGWWVRKKHPEVLPKVLQPHDHAKKVAALGKVTATSAPTPSPIAGLDPNMTSAEVQAANGLLQNSADPSALYAMASDYSDKGHNATARALIAKADALSSAQKHGASDEEIFQQMMAASGTTSQAAQAVPGVNPTFLGPNFS